MPKGSFHEQATKARPGFDHPDFLRQLLQPLVGVQVLSGFAVSKAKKLSAKVGRAQDIHAGRGSMGSAYFPGL